MALNFGATSSHVDFSIGGAANVTNGAFTMLTLWRPTNNFCSFVNAYNTSTLRRGFFTDTNHLFADSDFSSGFSTLSPNTDWWWLGMSKPSGANHIRWHVRDYSTAGSWSHGESTGSSNYSDPGTSNKIQIGAGTSNNSNGDVAVAAVFTSALADLTIEGACTSALSDLIAAGPAWAVRFQNSAPTSIQDLIGSGNETGRTGTITNVSDPSGFNFTTGGSSFPLATAFMSFF